MSLWENRGVLQNGRLEAERRFYLTAEKWEERKLKPGWIKDAMVKAERLVQEHNNWSFITKLSATLIFTSAICGDCRFQILLVCLSLWLSVYFKSSEYVGAPPLITLSLSAFSWDLSSQRQVTMWLFIKTKTKKTFFFMIGEKSGRMWTLPSHRQIQSAYPLLRSPALSKTHEFEWPDSWFLNMGGLWYWSPCHHSIRSCNASFWSKWPAGQNVACWDL